MAPKEKRTNILILMTDQQRYDTINAAGHSHMQTPNLDRLVQEGCLFTNAYSPIPICIPARHNLITGLPPRYHGFADNDFEQVTPSALPTLPRILSDAGYETRAIGKMHFRPVRRHNGFDKMELMEEVPEFREEDEYAMYLKQVGLGHIQNIHGVRNLLYMVPQQSLIPEEYHGTTWVADRSIEFIRVNRGRRPFLLWSSWIAPHPPFDLPDTWADLYRNADLPAPYVSRTPLSALAEENKMLGNLPGPAYVRRMRELYYAAISQVDWNLGRILAALNDIGELDNTLIIFVSDHGELLADYGLYQKWLPYDSCARIPLIVRYPTRVEPGSIRRQFVDLNDIMPTILDVVGLDYPGEIDLPGESLVSGNPAKDRSCQYTEYSRGNRRWISLRSHTHKYNYYYGGGREELFDLVADPPETTNLLVDGADQEVVRVKDFLRKKLIECERQIGLEGYVVGDDLAQLEPYRPRPHRNKAFPKFPDSITDAVEKEQMTDFFAEVMAAIEREPVVRLEELDLQSWQRNGNISDETIQKMLRKTKRTG
jgi:arylsulfatase A-like enzyme